MQKNLPATRVIFVSFRPTSRVPWGLSPSSPPRGSWAPGRSSSRHSRRHRGGGKPTKDELGVEQNIGKGGVLVQCFFLFFVNCVCVLTPMAPNY